MYCIHVSPFCLIPGASFCAGIVHRTPILALDELTARTNRETDAALKSLAAQMGVDWSALQPYADTTIFANRLFQIPQDEPFRNWEVCMESSPPIL